MSYQLNEKTKKHVSERIGIPYEQLIHMDWEEIDKHIEKKIGKKLTFPKEARILKMEEVDKKLDSIMKQKEDDWER